MEPTHIINTSQNVNIGLNIAGVGDRLMAIAIDYLIQAGFMLVLIFTLSGPMEDNLDMMVIMMAIFSFVIFLYFFFCEWLLGGQTVGKRYRKIKVIHSSGAQATVGQLLIRNLIRIVDSIYGIGFLVLFISKRSQRLGDLAAGTVVVSLKGNFTLEDTVHVDVSEDYIPVFSKVEILRLDERDLELIKEVINRNEKDLNFDVIDALSVSLKKKTNIESTSLENAVFLKRLLYDYQYYCALA